MWRFLTGGWATSQMKKFCRHQSSSLSQLQVLRENILQAVRRGFQGHPKIPFRCLKSRLCRNLLMFSIRSPRWSPRLIQSRNFVIERVAENEIPECPIGSVAIFFFFSLAKFSRLCSFPLPAKPRGGIKSKNHRRFSPFEIRSRTEKSQMKISAHTRIKAASQEVASRCAVQKF